jgi:glycosyltransferase involved in cell wall biosynthesis
MIVQNPSVSVVVPTRRGGPLLRRAVESILTQSYDGEIEVVVAFDREPPDRNGLDDLEAPGRHIRVVANERTRGPAGARNSGILQAKGEIIGFLDDDDVWVRSKVRLQLDAMRRHGADLCVSGVRYIADGRFKDHLPQLSDDVQRDIVDGSTFIPLEGMLVRSRALQEVGLLDESLSVSEDTDLMLRLAERFAFTKVAAPLVIVERTHIDRLSLDFERYRDAYFRMVSKHRDIFLRFPAGHTKRCWRLAGLALLTGNRPEARLWAWQAIRSDPRSPKNWAMVGCAELLPAVLMQPCLSMYQRFGWTKFSGTNGDGDSDRRDDVVAEVVAGD